MQIICTALSADEQNPLDVLAINAASAAVMISDIPWDGPVAAVRVGYLDDHFVINPTFADMENSLLDLRLAGTADGILMVEAGANELPEKMILEAMRFGHEAMQSLIELQQAHARRIGQSQAQLRAGQDGRRGGGICPRPGRRPPARCYWRRPGQRGSRRRPG